MTSAHLETLTRPAMCLDVSCQRGAVIQSWGRAGAMTKESRSALADSGLAVFTFTSQWIWCLWYQPSSQLFANPLPSIDCLCIRLEASTTSAPCATAVHDPIAVLRLRHPSHSESSHQAPIYDNSHSQVYTRSRDPSRQATCSAHAEIPLEHCLCRLNASRAESLLTGLLP